MKKQTYKDYAQSKATPSPLFKNMLKAFLSGGTICVIGQAFSDLYRTLGIAEKTAWALTGVTLIFLAVLLTGLGVFDKIADFAGAGTLVPITGFANAMSSPAIDAKSEGFVLGVGAKVFTVAGPVILYGTVASVLYGIIYWGCKILFEK
ncbi:MAG: stage V sporulation protein AC [Clostridia bacterium]|nr:stage V sporulation protein AC [Clostridia bacterium]MBQ8398810.1 stage V sporulation protein AC [Clostridia bacterium]